MTGTLERRQAEDVEGGPTGRKTCACAERIQSSHHLIISSKLARDVGRIPMLRVDGVVHPPHVGDGDSAGQACQRAAEFRVREENSAPDDWRGIVRRKVVAVVVEHGESVRLDESARCVSGDEIDLMLGQGAVNERQIHRGRWRGKAQAVGAGKTREPVLALEKLVAEPGPSCAGARGQVRQRSQTQPPRIVAADEHGEGVLEPERIQQSQPGVRITPADRGEHTMRGRCRGGS